MSDVLKICKNCENSFTGFGESSMCLGLRCSEHDKFVDDNDTCSLFELSSHHLVNQLKQQLAERDALILELEKVREFYANPNCWHDNSETKYINRNCISQDSEIALVELTQRHVTIGGKLARTPLKNQKLLDEIKGRVE